MVPVKHEGKDVGVVQVMAAGPVLPRAARDRRGPRRAHGRRRPECAPPRRAPPARGGGGDGAPVAAERERAASVLDAVGDGIFLVDSDGVVRFWNRAAALVTGRSADEASDRPAAETFADWNRSPSGSRCRARQVCTLDDAPGLRRGVGSLALVHRRARPERHRLRLPRPDGRARPRRAEERPDRDDLPRVADSDGGRLRRCPDAPLPRGGPRPAKRRSSSR